MYLLGYHPVKSYHWSTKTGEPRKDVGNLGNGNTMQRLPCEAGWMLGGSF